MPAPCPDKFNIKLKRVSVFRQIREYFYEIDSDGSGKLDPTEFSEMLDKIGVQVEKLEMMKIYKRADVNGDGTVSFREFMAAFANDSNNR